MTQTNVLPQLQEVIQGLEAQEDSLTQQLAETQKKLEGIRTVISMFEGSDTATESVPEAAAPAKSTAKKAKTTKTTTKTTAKAKAKASETSKSTTKTAAKKAGKKKKKDGRAATWQKYTLPGVGDHSIPEAVQLVLATQPDKDFKIAEVMSALFKEGMPKNQYLKARNRISNVLSGGVRDGEWYKGERGAYRLSKPA
ncbi:MAG: hypothetical protein AAFU53_05295 [Cyanobacteria bacterium J06632_3]